MKKQMLLFAFFVLISISNFATVWTINNSGTTFSPASITINSGDSVRFVIASNHNVLEVSQSTYNSNGTTALGGGFSLPFGGGLILPSSLTAGTHYYVCIPHASMGMKGTILVNNTTEISELSSISNITIFPNPASSVLFLTLTEDVQNLSYEMIDIKGNSISEGSVSGNSASIDISQFPQGIYVLSLGTKKEKMNLLWLKN
jgi:plastocyanin